VSYPHQLPSHHHINTKECKKIKMINLSHMISILNFVFTILFYTTSRTKQAPTSISFEEFLNQKPFESNFQFLAAQKSFPILFPFFLSVLDHQYSFSYLFDPSHTLNHIFSPTQSIVQPNRAFGPPTQFPLAIFNLEMTIATFGLSGLPHCSSLCHPHLAPWSCLTSSHSSSMKTVVPRCFPFPVSISCNRHHLFYRRGLPSLDRPPFATLRPYKRRNESTPFIQRTHPGSIVSSSRPEPSLHQSTIGRLC
jgi:hypothetical protein